MSTRQFDPVFSAALRNELEALADLPEATEARPRPRRLLLARPQLWVSLVTAVVLAVVTVGVLRLTHATEPAERSTVVDPLSEITDPANTDYVARSVQTLITARGTGSGTRSFDVPPGVTSMRIYVDCSPEGHHAVEIDHRGASSGDCSRTIGGWFDMPVTAGTHDVTIGVRKGTAYSLLIIATPPPTVSSGALIDPLAQLQDRRDPDALDGRVDTVLGVTAAAGDSGGTSSTPLRSSDRLRAYFVCRTASATASATVDGHRLIGCMNSIAHWFDFTPRSTTLTARVGAAGPSALLVVRAPQGATDSLEPATLPYPSTGGRGRLLAEARGSGAPASGTYRKPGATVLLTLTCRGTGWLEIETGDGGTSTRGHACSTKEPDSVGFGGDRHNGARPWTVIPHGDVSWTFQLSADD